MPKVLPAHPVRYLVNVKECHKDLIDKRVALYDKMAGRQPVSRCAGFNPGRTEMISYQFPTAAARNKALRNFQITLHSAIREGLIKVCGEDTIEQPKKRPRLGVVLGVRDIPFLFGFQL